MAETALAIEIQARDATGDDLRHYLYWTSHHGRHEWLLGGADKWLELNPDATALDLFRFLETAEIRLDDRTLRRAARWIWGDDLCCPPPLRPGQHQAHTVPRDEVRQGFPPGAHLKGGRASAPINAAMAREFYEPIVPIVMELRRRGLSLRAIGAELEARGIRTRNGGCYGYPWAAAQVRRVLIRGAAVEQERARVSDGAGDASSQ